jgi:hypothetical protein
MDILLNYIQKECLDTIPPIDLISFIQGQPLQSHQSHQNLFFLLLHN